METLYHWIIEHAKAAPWILFGLFLLAGLNIPISIDILVVIASILAATILPESTLTLYLSAWAGCYFSGWLAYWMGRLVGYRLLKFKWMAKMLPPARLEKIGFFYQKHGFLTLLIGRFIPFGIRNGIFMSTGIARSSFKKFMLRDLIPVFIWTTSTFYLFHTLGSNYDLLVKYVKIINLTLFCSFGVTVIALICYKRRKAKKRNQATLVANECDNLKTP